MSHDFDEAGFVPIAHEAEVEVHDAVHLALVFFEKGGAFCRGGKGGIDGIGGIFGGFHGDEDAGAEHGIDEAGGVAREEPAVAGEGFVAVGVVALGVDFADAGGIRHAAPDFGLLAEHGFERFLGAFLEGFEGGDVEDHADAHQCLAEGDHPDPAVAVADQARVGALLAGIARDVFVMREDGEFLEVRIRFFEGEKIADDGVASAAIDDVARADLLLFAAGLDGDADFIRAEDEALDGSLLHHGRAVFRGVIKQQLVEFRADDLVGALVFGTVGVLEIEFHGAGAAGGADFRAVFMDEFCVEFFADTEALEGAHAVGEERFADVEAGEFLLFKHDDAAPLAGEEGGGGAAGGTPADDCDVVDLLH